MFGVTTVARGMRRVLSASTASSRSSLAPPFATMTGSTTSGVMPCSVIFSATVSMISAPESMPVLTASAPMSEMTASICDRIIEPGMSTTSVTVCVFWEVMAVRTDVPYTHMAAKVFRSACMPAPPPESDPAIVIAFARFIMAVSLAYC